jgi:hypothetical protein
MKTVTIDWKDNVGDESKRAIEMSAWCKHTGLKHDVDYGWWLDNKNRKTYFKFKKDSMSSMFILKWS